MHIKEKGKHLSHLKASNSGKVEGINIISSTFHSNTSNFSTTISFKSGKV